VRVSDAEELTGGSDPADVAVENASRKAQAVWRAGPDPIPPTPDDPAGGAAGLVSPAPPARSTSVVLGVDTVVVLDGAIYGKPGDEGAARATLARLAGRTHDVVSGLAVVEEGAVRTAAATTRVTFRALDDATLDWYVATGEWRERAGGYAIQGRGAALVAGIDGDYLNVVGLPVAALLDLLPDLLQDGAHTSR
jgi:septum formation protein